MVAFQQTDCPVSFGPVSFGPVLFGPVLFASCQFAALKVSALQSTLHSVKSPLATGNRDTRSRFGIDGNAETRVAATLAGVDQEFPKTDSPLSLLVVSTIIFGLILKART